MLIGFKKQRTDTGVSVRNRHVLDGLRLGFRLINSWTLESRTAIDHYNMGGYIPTT